ncbi:hypothetical protein TNIN_212831 [Trichonephila inaurata madagascariensis]|uniref:Uncharacterized protein n=1 Tax=Trichonephila inaurata madagascariensis TaxID=2747483 RepID=A0A8X6WUE6_9ARAC|nr:hypothetical protein TNIN_212831 [Trichonephila inaurata madagascariensis]
MVCNGDKIYKYAYDLLTCKADLEVEEDPSQSWGKVRRIYVFKDYVSRQLNRSIIRCFGAIRYEITER